MATFEDQLQRIHREISINDEDRQPYTDMYNTIRDWLLKEMCEADPVFNTMYKGTSLFGSYPNRVRIIKPSEFDVFILMDLPFKFTVKTHPDRLGFVQISSKEWKYCATDSKTKKIYRGLFRHNKRHGLNRNKLKLWIQSIIEYVLSCRPQPTGYIIEYTCCSVAHQIYVREEREPHKTISIDFVPAILMPKEYMKSLVRKRACLKDKYYESFVAIPKPLNGYGSRYSRALTFQLVNPVAERDIIWDKKNLKVVHRLLKSLRNKYKLRLIKSYFLTAVFLQQVTKCNYEFWQQSVSYIFLYMLEKLMVYFKHGNLPYYWVSDFNLLSILRPKEIAHYTDILTAAYNDLTKLANQNSVSCAEVAKHFKTTPKAFFNIATFDDQLQRIHQEISIKDEDRSPYNDMYNTIRDWLMKEMCEFDPVFNTMYKGTSLFGSHPNRVRIIKPSKFEVFILMDLPFEFTVKTHPDRPGCVQISSEDWKYYAKDSKTKKQYRGLFRHNKRNGLNRNKLELWIQSIIEYVLSCRPQPTGYIIEYTSCSVAHQIYVQEKQAPHKTISIDFVPAIRMPKEYMKPLIRKQACLKDEYYETFVAIPKSLDGCGSKLPRVLTFQLVNPVAERDIIWDKQNIKVVYRLLKFFRNQYNLRSIKSYFLKAVFLQQVTKCNDEFWQQSVGYIFLYMLEKLMVYFKHGNLPYYWVSDFNLLSILRPKEIAHYTDILTAAYNDLTKLENQNSVSYAVVAEHFKRT